MTNQIELAKERELARDRAKQEQEAAQAAALIHDPRYPLLLKFIKDGEELAESRLVRNLTQEGGDIQREFVNAKASMALREFFKAFKTAPLRAIENWEQTEKELRERQGNSMSNSKSPIAEG